MKRDILILLALSAAVLLFNLGGGSLGSWDEAYYAQISREMVQSGNWVDLTWGGEAWSEKPPLYMWATAVFYTLFGVNEFSARLFSALSGIGVVIVTYLLSTRLFLRRTGLLAGIMMLSTYHFMWFGRMAFLDVVFTFFTLLSIYFFLIAEDHRNRIILSFLCFGLAFFTKGVGAFIIPMIVGLYVIACGKWDMVFNRYTACGLLVFLALVGGWYAAIFQRYGDLVIKEHFLIHLFKRTGQSMDGHSGTWLSYLNAVLYKGKPWGSLGLIVFPVFAFFAIRGRKRKEYLLISWVLVMFIVFSVVRTKLHWYIIPVYPAIISVAAWGVERVLRSSSLLVVSLVSLASLVYFGMEKDVFRIDNNPGIKSFAETVKNVLTGEEEVYLFDTGDPGMRFYFGGFSRNVGPDDLSPLELEGTGAVLITGSDRIGGLGVRGKVIARESENFTAIRVE